MKLRLANSTLIAFVAIGSIGPATQAAVIGSYTFDGNSTAASGVAPNVTFSNFSAGSGVTLTGTPPGFEPGNPGTGSAYSGRAWTTTSTIDPSDYFQFTIAPQTGFFLTVETLGFDFQRTATAPTSVDLRSSLDNYASALRTFSLTGTAFAPSTATLSSAFTNLATAVTFRLYGYGNLPPTGTANGILRVDNVVASSTTPATPVPFEFSPTLGLLALGAWGAIEHLKRNKKVDFSKSEDKQPASSTISE